MFKNKILSKILSAVAIAGFGLLMLDFVLFLDNFFHEAVLAAIGVLGPSGVVERSRWFPIIMHFAFLAIIGAVSWPVFRSKIKPLYKAIWLPVPVAAVSVTIGIFFYAWPAAVYALNAFFYAAILHYFGRTEKPWLYYYAVFLAGLVLIFLLLKGGDI
ncbi:MAG TPA: hypothetical protein P5080_02815 [Candidatus Paceibacterota bacterium]|nr:hypothetical protein [Candidatus Pacearchaeota archaeon]HRZ50901.1 hypothetical protein [Candidatus Paceibacterota bacterium]HSA36622.1 hypothetical protein [Candidatus Paceibacterota bacterium]